MKGVILAGGKGERLMPLTECFPKPMIKIAGKPLLEHQINLFKKYGIKEVLLCLHYLPEKIMTYFGDGSEFGVNIHYSIEKYPLGTAGALKNDLDFFDDSFILIYGDNYANINLKTLIDFHMKKKAMVTIVLQKKKASEKSSSLVELDENSEIIRFVERPDEKSSIKKDTGYKYVNAGIYVLEPNVLDSIPNKKFDFAYDLFPLLLKNNERLFGYGIPKGTYFREVGTIEKLNAIKEEFENDK